MVSLIAVLVCLGTLTPVRGHHPWNDTHPYDPVKLMLVSETQQQAMPGLAGGPEEVCYAPFGCFTREPIGSLPEEPKRLNVKFYLFTNRTVDAVNTYDYHLIIGREDNRTQASLRNSSKRLVFIAHGFAEDGNLIWFRAIKEIKTSVDHDNVVIIDWSHAARSTTLYIGAAANSFLVGRMTAALALKLAVTYNIPIENVEIVGFSLGAQVAGFFAKEIFDRTGKRIGKLTALDCAAPLFEKNGIHPYKHHTLLLEAVHTSAGYVPWLGRIGFLDAFGHVDFYFNGGEHQPGCTFLDVTCTHLRAVRYYIDALTEGKKCRFHGFLCKSVQQAVVGKCDSALDRHKLFVDTRNTLTDKAIVYVKTGAHEPFCMT